MGRGDVIHAHLPVIIFLFGLQLGYEHIMNLEKINCRQKLCGKMWHLHLHIQDPEKVSRRLYLPGPHTYHQQHMSEHGRKTSLNNSQMTIQLEQ